MAKKKRPVLEGAPEWIVTFADLMSLLTCFFVLIISFSIQDKQKLQVVAGSMREAFGVKKIAKRAGMIEMEGVPVREYVKQVASVERENDTDYADEAHDQRTKQGPEADTHEFERNDITRPQQFSLAAASLRQAWQEMPDIAELSDNLLVEETPEGLNIQLMDQEGRSMFAAHSSEPNEYTVRLLQKMAKVLRQMPNRVKITGHTDATKIYGDQKFTTWDLTAKRANAARRILSEAGVPGERFHSVVGKADTEPLFPEDTFMAANRRITILLMKEAPPAPPDQKL